MNDTFTPQCAKSVDADLRAQANSLQRILVADDEEVMRRLIAKLLAGCGYDVDSAEDGAIAWEALQTKRYDLLITDNSMPNLTGIALVKMLRGRDAALPVVMVSGSMPTDDPNWHPSLGISAFLLKPFGLGALRETVENILRAAVPAVAQCRMMEQARALL
jgi:CheY-like chemotaxis protein